MEVQVIKTLLVRKKFVLTEAEGKAMFVLLDVIDGPKMERLGLTEEQIHLLVKMWAEYTEVDDVS